MLGQFKMTTDHIPDSLKLTAATSPTVLNLWGIPVEQWMFIASAVVSIMFVIEKAPVCIRNIKIFINWIKDVKQKKSTNSNRCKSEVDENCSSRK